MKKNMKNEHIVMVPTNRVNNNVMWKLKDGTKLHLGNDGIDGAWKDGVIECLHLYVFSNELINIGDWFIWLKYNLIVKAIKNDDNIECKKIIGTTDPKLIAEGINAIDPVMVKQFITAYNKSNNK